jgi:hypothetical protein
MYTKPMVELAVFLLYSRFRAQISTKGLKIHHGIPASPGKHQDNIRP